MNFILVTIAMCIVIWLYFTTNPLHHSRKFMIRRFINWFPMGMTYAFLYMARYNLNVSKNALGSLMSNNAFGIIFGVGATVYAVSLIFNGPFVDKIGGKKGMVIACLGSCIANVAMGLVTYLLLKGQITGNVVLIFSVLYGVNMFFQSYGAVSIIKVKSYWFHVRERGVFGAIFGTLISFGVYFAFDWGSAIADAATLKPGPHGFNGAQKLIRTLFAIDTGTTDATWLVFFIPAFLLIFWALINMITLKDTPSQANFEDFDTCDASSGEMEVEYSIGGLLKRFFTNPILLAVSAIEFSSGAVRNGVIQWYYTFAKQVPQPGAEFFYNNWGLLLCLTGVIGGFLSGWMSDRLFQSRRGPPAAILSGCTLVLLSLMAFFIFSSPIIAGLTAVLISLTGIGVHAIMSGTAAADFGGRKGAATAAGVTDGFVYLGTGVQSFCIGALVEKSWSLFPIFLIPFAIAAVFLALRIWKAIPEATKRYLLMVEKVTMVEKVIVISKEA